MRLGNARVDYGLPPTNRQDAMSDPGDFAHPRHVGYALDSVRESDIPTGR
jgi:hypothetical protein